jgi:hypothetical protein
MPVVFPAGMAGHPCPTLRATSLSLQGEPADIRRDDLGPPVVPGGDEIGLGSRNLRPRAEARTTECAVSKVTTWPNGEWRYNTRRHMLEPMRPEAVPPDRALYLPTLSHFLIVKNLLIVKNY